MAKGAIKAGITRGPILVDLALQGGGSHGHSRGACSIVCSRYITLERSFDPATGEVNLLPHEITHALSGPNFAADTRQGNERGAQAN